MTAPHPTCPRGDAISNSRDARAADALTTAADAIREAEGVYDAVDAYFIDRDLDVDAEDVARALLEAASALMGVRP